LKACGALFLFEIEIDLLRWAADGYRSFERRVGLIGIDGRNLWSRRRRWRFTEFVDRLQSLSAGNGHGVVPRHGAIVELDGRIIGRGFNHPIAAADPTAHAEISAIRDAASRTGNYRLTGSTLCVTIEPCLMCVGALVHARIGTLVYGAAEPRTGAVVSTVRGGELPGHNHRFEVVAGVREAECRGLIQAFFKDRR
jgi:tRNA(adenine34) deaminase